MRKAKEVEAGGEEDEEEEEEGKLHEKAIASISAGDGALFEEQPLEAITVDSQQQQLEEESGVVQHRVHDEEPLDALANAEHASMKATTMETMETMETMTDGRDQGPSVETEQIERRRANEARDEGEEEEGASEQTIVSAPLARMEDKPDENPSLINGHDEEDEEVDVSPPPSDDEDRHRHDGLDEAEASERQPSLGTEATRPTSKREDERQSDKLRHQGDEGESDEIVEDDEEQERADALGGSETALTEAPPQTENETVMVMVQSESSADMTQEDVGIRTAETQAKECNDRRHDGCPLDSRDEENKDEVEMKDKDEDEEEVEVPPLDKDFVIDTQELLAFIVAKYTELAHTRRKRPTDAKSPETTSTEEDESEDDDEDDEDDDEEEALTPKPLTSVRSVIVPDTPRSLVDVVWSRQQRSSPVVETARERRSGKAHSERKPRSERGTGAVKRLKAKTSITKTSSATRSSSTAGKEEDEGASSSSMETTKARWVEEREREEAMKEKDRRRARELEDLYHLTPRRTPAALATRAATSIGALTPTPAPMKTSTPDAETTTKAAVAKTSRESVKDRERSERRARKKAEAKMMKKEKKEEKEKKKSRKSKAKEYSHSMSRVPSRREPAPPSLASPCTYAAPATSAAAADSTPTLQQLAAVSRSTPHLVGDLDKAKAKMSRKTKKAKKKKSKEDDDEGSTKKKKMKAKRKKEEKSEAASGGTDVASKSSKSLLREGSRRMLRKIMGDNRDEHAAADVNVGSSSS